MRWKINIEGSDEITRGQRCEFEIEKNFEDLADGSVGLSIGDGKAILASLQRHLVQQQSSLYILLGPFNSLGCIVCRGGLYSLPVLAEERQDALENQY